MKIGVGVNRASTALSFIEKYGHLDRSSFMERISVDGSMHPRCLCSEKVGAAILDDGMQVRTIIE